MDDDGFYEGNFRVSTILTAVSCMCGHISSFRTLVACYFSILNGNLSVLTGNYVSYRRADGRTQRAGTL